MPIICQCAIASRKDFEHAADCLDTNPATPVRKVAGQVLLHVRAGKTCMGGCGFCMPEVKRVVEERRLIRASSPARELEPI